MDLRLPDTTQLFGEQARAWLAAQAAPERLAELEADATGFDAGQWAALVELGWPAVALPLSIGGGGGTLLDLGVLATEIGRAAYPSPFLTVATAGLVSARLGTTKRAAAVLESIAHDGTVASLVWSPGCGTQLLAERRGETIKLAGRAVVDWATAAGTLIVVAPLAGEGAAAVVAVDVNAPGVSIGGRRSFDNERAGVVEFNGVNVEADDQLVPGGTVAGVEAAEVLGAVRLIRAAELCGVAERTLEMTAGYVSTRRQFGVPLGTFQAVQHSCADVAILVHGARLATDEGLATDAGTRKAGAIAGWLAGRAAVAAAVAGAQLHGGVGMIREYPLHFYYRKAKAAQLRLGSAAEQLEELAAVLVDPVAERGAAPAAWL